MKVLCPNCGQSILGDDLNVATDIARCAKCDEVFTLSMLVQAVASRPLNLNDPPRGAWYQSEYDGFAVGATTRNAVALFLVPFMCVWSGFSIGGIYGSQIIQGRFNLLMSLFGIPFVLGTLLFGSIALMTVCGKVVVRVSDSGGVIFAGVGRLGWRRVFDPLEITNVRVELGHGGSNGPTRTIVLDGPHKLRFGSGLSEPRLDFIANVLRHELPKCKRTSGVFD
jgi:hypothetical protein